MTQRSSGLPPRERLVELLAGEFAAAGYEVEDLTIDERTSPPRITVVADGDTALDLDAVAGLSRAASMLLDALGGGTDAYVLEVTSPGVDRPLTAEKHFRRARGRKVVVDLADGSALTGRLGAVVDSVAELVVRDRNGWSIRRIPLTFIRNAVVQVEFSPPSAEELELATDQGPSAGTEVGI